MTYLLETDRVVDWLQGRPDAVGLLRRIAADGVAISLITYGEVLDGIYYGRNPTLLGREFESFLRWVDVLPLTRSIMQRFARERGRLRQEGQKIADLDMLIAATVLDHDLILVTRNLRHYARISGIRIYGVPE